MTRLRGITLTLICAVPAGVAQEIDWHSIDGGGGISAANDIQVIGVVGQKDSIRMRGGDISLSGGYLPLPPLDPTIFRDGFE